MIVNIKNSSKLFRNLTPKIQEEANKWGKSGLVNIYSRHTSAFIKILEDEILLHADIRFFLDKTFPKHKPDNRRYLHDLISLRQDVDEDERINAFSHMRGLYFNTSETIPVNKGELLIGKWQSIFFVELDPVRDREYIITFCEN
jgi:secondary thiamine-phosphate synthase enzyme